MIWRWKGCERLFGTSLIACKRQIKMADSEGQKKYLLYGSDAHLHEWVN